MHHAHKCHSLYRIPQEGRQITPPPLMSPRLLPRFTLIFKLRQLVSAGLCDGGQIPVRRAQPCDGQRARRSSARKNLGCWDHDLRQSAGWRLANKLHTHTHTHKHTHTHTQHTHTLTHTHTHTNTHNNNNTHARTCTHAHTHTRLHTRLHTHTHTHTYTHKRAHPAMIYLAITAALAQTG